MIPNSNYGKEYTEERAEDSSSCVLDVFPLLLKAKTLASVAHWAAASSRAPKSGMFDSQSGHMGFKPMRHMEEATGQCFSLTKMFLSPFSFPSLKKNQMSLGEDKEARI